MRWYTCFVAGDVVAEARAHSFFATYAFGETAIEIYEIDQNTARTVAACFGVVRHVTAK